MSQLNEALELAEKLHEGQVDKLGVPYINHVKYVSGCVTSHGETYAIVGLLHNAVEDTEITFEEIERQFGKIVCDGVEGMTKREGEDYFDDYLPRVKTNPISIIVKIADSGHNLSRNHLIEDPIIREKLKIKYTSVLRFLGASEETINSHLTTR